MIFRVKLKVGYYERWFDFSSSGPAALFAQTVLEHEVSSEDHKDKDMSVSIDVIRTEDDKNELEF